MAFCPITIFFTFPLQAIPIRVVTHRGSPEGAYLLVGTCYTEVMVNKKIVIFVMLPFLLLFLHYFLDRFFRTGLAAFFPYRNRITKQCVQISGDAYHPPWFSLLYASDQTCFQKLPERLSK